MLSILIPVYNYNVYPLILELHKQCMKLKIVFEIIVIDDYSSNFLIENEKVNTLFNASYEILDSNIGRSCIRNLLANKAQYKWLLFLDSDVFPKNENFIESYIKQINTDEKVVYGGIKYQKEKPDKSKMLRWVYGNSREALSVEKRNKNPYLSFLTLNFLIKKVILDKEKFNENIPNLRHEDTLFSYNLMQKKIKIIHIENPVFHYGLDTFDIAIKKERESLIALKYLIDKKLMAASYVRISKLFSKIKYLKLTPIIAFFHTLTLPIFIKNLSSNYPSLFIFDLYRLGYLCTLETK